MYHWLEFDTAANESHHKPTKYAARLTQRNEATFQMQVATRMFEFQILDLALHELQTGERISDYFAGINSSAGSSMSTSATDSQSSASNDQPSDGDSQPSDASNAQASASNSEESDPVILTDDTQIRVYRDEETGESTFRLLTKSKWADQTVINMQLLDFLVELQEKITPHTPLDYLSIYTRHVRGKHIFRGHPNFRGQGPWKDWAIIDWGTGYGDLPGHISCFVDIQGVPNGIHHGGIAVRDGVYAVVESSHLDTDQYELGKSDLFVPFYKDVHDAESEVPRRDFYLADTEAIQMPCAMIPDIGGPKNRYFMVKPRTRWHREFIEWLERPHHEDDMSDEEAG